MPFSSCLDYSQLRVMWDEWAPTGESFHAVYGSVQKCVRDGQELEIDRHLNSSVNVSLAQKGDESAVTKTAVGKPTVGSNPTPSASFKRW